MAGTSGVGISNRYNDSTYLRDNPTWHQEDSPWKTEQIARILRANEVACETIAEVGCGAGEILVGLAREFRSSQLSGYEQSRDAFELAKVKETDRIRFFLEDFTETEEAFSVLLCIDVFEHVEDYMSFLRLLKGKARRHVFHIPLDLSMLSLARNTMMRARNSLGHLHYFSPATALATLADTGYEVVDHCFTAPFQRGGIKAQTSGAKVLGIPRRALFRISPKLLNLTLGGCSLLVLTK